MTIDKRVSIPVSTKSMIFQPDIRQSQLKFISDVHWLLRIQFPHLLERATASLLANPTASPHTNHVSPGR